MPSGWSRSDSTSEWAATMEVSKLLGMKAETLRRWIRRAEVDGGFRPGLTTDERTRLRQLEKGEPRAPTRQRDPEGRVGFLRGRAGRPNEAVVAYIDSRKDRFGVQPICRALQFAPATYYAIKQRERTPCRRYWRDLALRFEIGRVFNENRRVYGANKVWHQLNREGITVARCTVERLMRDMGLRGVRRGRTWKTTITDDTAPRPRDLVERTFCAPAPNLLWVADLTYVKSHQGFCYVAFVIDVYSRRIVGWQVSTSLRSDLALDSLEMAIYSRNRAELKELVHHSDRGVQFVCIRYTERLSEAGIEPSVGSKGDNCDDALAESFNGLYKAELIYLDGPWKSSDDVEWATLTYVHWFNNKRLHGEIGMVPPAEFEDAYYRDTRPVEMAESDT